jgi:hypothetical protein
MTIRNLSYFFLIKIKNPRREIEHDEIVPGPFHLGELELHPISLR